MTTDQASREAFEKWAKDNGFDVNKHRDGSYFSLATTHAYKGYQAALTHANTEMEKMREALEETILILDYAARKVRSRSDKDFINDAIAQAKKQFTNTSLAGGE